jgi:hypothetical protein
MAYRNIHQDGPVSDRYQKRQPSAIKAMWRPRLLFEAGLIRSNCIRKGMGGGVSGSIAVGCASHSRTHESTAGTQSVLATMQVTLLQFIGLEGRGVAETKTEDLLA